MWMFAALDTLEPPIFDRAMVGILERDEPWYEQRLRVLDDRVRKLWGVFPAALVMQTGSMAPSAPATS